MRGAISPTRRFFHRAAISIEVRFGFFWQQIEALLEAGEKGHFGLGEKGQSPAH